MQTEVRGVRALSVIGRIYSKTLCSKFENYQRGHYASLSSKLGYGIRFIVCYVRFMIGVLLLGILLFLVRVLRSILTCLSKRPVQRTFFLILDVLLGKRSFSWLLSQYVSY
jgi:hypothetical protein